DKGSQWQSIPVNVNVPAVFDFHGDSSFADGEDEVYLRFCASFREMCDVHMRESTEEISRRALRYMPGDIAQVCCLRKRVGVQRDRFLKPTGAQAVIANTNLIVSLLSLQTQFQRCNQLDEHRAIQETQVGQDALPS